MKHAFAILSASVLVMLIGYGIWLLVHRKTEIVKPGHPKYEEMQRHFGVKPNADKSTGNSGEIASRPEIVIPEDPNDTVDYSKLISGRFVLDLKNVDWAGFRFVDENTIIWTNEMFPNDPDTFQLNWLSNSVFTATSPNLKWTNRIVSFDGKHLVIDDLDLKKAGDKQKVYRSKFIRAEWLETDEYQ